MSNINNLDCAKSYFKEFIEFSQIEVSQDFLKYLSQINRLPNYCPLGEEFSFIDLCLSWHSSPFGYNYIYWWKLQTLFIVFLIYKNTNTFNQSILAKNCIKCFQQYHSDDNLKKNIYKIIKPCLKRNKKIIKTLDDYFKYD